MTAELVDLNWRSWLTLPLERLIFPKICCRCGAETAELLGFTGEAKASILGVLGQLGGVQRTLSVSVPFCASCQNKRRAMKRRWALGGFLIGAVVGSGVALSFPFEGIYGSSWAVGARVISMILGLGIGPLAGHALARRKDPVRLRNYLERDRTVQIWFERARYRDLVKGLVTSGDDLEQ